MPTSIRVLALAGLAAALLAADCSRKTSNVLNPSVTSVALPGVSIIQDANTMYCTDTSTPSLTHVNVNQDVICTTFDGVTPALVGDIEYQCGGSGWVYVNYHNPPAPATDNAFAYNVAHGPARTLAYSGSYGPDSNDVFSYLRLYGHNGGTYYSPSQGVTTTPVSDALGVGSTQANRDFYIRWEGHKVGANSSFDYANITMYFNSLRAPHSGMDMRNYQGFSFYARGKGNFGVGLNAGNAGGLPYKDYNVFELVFGDQLIDETRWRQIVVYFQDMKQLYLGKGYVNINDVLANLSGIQFQQETPVTQDFALDLDYIRFF